MVDLVKSKICPSDCLKEVESLVKDGDSCMDDEFEACGGVVAPRRRMQPSTAKFDFTSLLSIKYIKRDACSRLLQSSSKSLAFC